MKRIRLLLFGALCCLIAPAAFTYAQAPSQANPAGVYNRLLGMMEKQIVGAADAMPTDKFNFAPTQGDFKGVRTFAQQVKHIAAVNYMIAAAILSEKPPVDLGGENGPDNITSKADVVKFLKDSFTYLHKAANSIDENNVLGLVQGPFGPYKASRLGLSIIAISHPFDHYGQMVEYLRMNNIIPPASRPRK